MRKFASLLMLVGVSAVFLFSFASRGQHSPQAVVLKTEKVYSAKTGQTYYFYHVEGADYARAISASGSTMQYIDDDTGCVRSPGNCTAIGAKERVVIVSGT